MPTNGKQAFFHVTHKLLTNKSASPKLDPQLHTLSHPPLTPSIITSAQQNPKPQSSIIVQIRDN
jgi:hypothetical protein